MIFVEDKMQGGFRYASVLMMPERLDLDNTGVSTHDLLSLNLGLEAYRG